MAFSISGSISENLSTRFSCSFYTFLTHWLYLSPRDLHLPNNLCSTSSQNPYFITSSLAAPTIITTLEFISMEDLTLPPTTTTTTNNNINTTLYNQEQPRTVLDPQISNMAHNGQIFSINETQSFAPTSVMSHSHIHDTSYFMQSHNHTLNLSHVHAHDVPLMFPAYLYRVEGSGMGTGAPNLSLREFPDRVLSEFQEQRNLPSSVTKAARSRRKMARQKSASLQINSSGSGSSSSLPCGASQIGNSDSKDLYTFCTPDNRKLKILLKKVLTSSDVGTLGRIILPKREAERNLPSISSKEGIQMVIRDVYSTQETRMRYRFWSNNKDRMYILDQMGNFVEQNGLEIGDCITLYEDKSKNLYFSIRKTEKPAQQLSNEPTNASHNYINTSFTQESIDEENSSLKILMDELKHTEQEAANSLVTLYTDGASSTPSLGMGGSQEPFTRRYI